MTPLHACRFGLFERARSEPRVQPNGPLGVTVAVRCIPLMTAAYGMQVARPGGTTMHAPGGDGSLLGQKSEAVLGDHRLVGKSPEGSRQLVRLELWPAS
jgi:hypothetical protein